MSRWWLLPKYIIFREERRWNTISTILVWRDVTIWMLDTHHVVWEGVTWSQSTPRCLMTGQARVCRVSRVSRVDTCHSLMITRLVFLWSLTACWHCDCSLTTDSSPAVVSTPPQQQQQRQQQCPDHLYLMMPPHNYTQHMKKDISLIIKQRLIHAFPSLKL